MSKLSKVRIDQLLLDLGLARDMHQARALIMAAKVVVDERRVDKPGERVDATSKVRIKGQKAYVSRGGEKLASAISHFQLKPEFADANVLDIGASTGGFTDCALAHGAQRVFALDVGVNQLHWSLRSSPKVVSLENTDIREFDASSYPRFAWILADISFNRLRRLAPYIVKAASAETKLLVLVKPQFEIASAKVPKGGVVDSQALRDEALAAAVQAFAKEGLACVGHYDSSIKGRSGNQETFILLKKASQA